VGTITIVITNVSAVADMPPKCLYEHIRQRPPYNCENNISATFDALYEEDPFKLSGSYFMAKLEWLGSTIW